MSEEYVLYDLPSKQDNQCWSPNTWKARAALNFKGVAYRTEFVRYPDLGTTLGKELGIPPNPEGSFSSYTLPVVRFPDGTYVMDSADIAKKLESVHPQPSLRLNDELQQQVQDIIRNIIFPMAPFVFLRVHNKIITDSEQAWFRNDRERRAAQALKRDKISLEEWETVGGGEEALLEASEPGMARLSKFLAEHKQDSGPFVLGSKPCFLDLMIVGLEVFYRRIGDGAHEQLLESVAGLTELCAACEPWFRRNNH